jgi:hypothetical protein
MAPAIIYLDPDDEITSAAARIRAAEPAQIAIVLPPGSRIGTSRMNFRLLAREAEGRNRRLAVVVADPSGRALAAAAGIDVFASVSELEAAVAAGWPALPTPGAGRGSGGGEGGGRVGPTTGGGPGSGTTPEPGQPPGEPPVRARSAAAEVRLPAPRGSSRRRTLVAGLILAGVVLLGLAAALLVPAVEVVVTPATSAVGPLVVEVTVDPAATAPDPVAGVVPATTVTVPLEADGVFPATGRRVVETKARGRVTFDSINTVGPVYVPAGTRLATLDGVVFATAAAVTVPAATVSGDHIDHGTAQVDVVAIQAGSQGNVAAGAITQVPDFLRTLRVAVRNDSPTAGGSHEEFPLVTQADVAAAEKALGAKLSAVLQARLADPTTAPSGLLLVPDTATIAPPTPSVDPTGLVGRQVDQFTLGLRAVASVLAYDPAAVRHLAEQRLAAAVPPGFTLLAGSAVVEVDRPRLEGGKLRIAATVRGAAVPPLDPAALAASIRGRSVDEARALLARRGSVTLSVVPDWLPVVVPWARISVRVVEPSAAPSTAPVPLSSPPASAPAASASPASGPPASAPPASALPVSPSAVPTLPETAPPSPSGWLTYQRGSLAILPFASRAPWEAL